MRRSPLPLTSVMMLAACLILAARNAARAGVNPWEFEVYPYATESRGIGEIETDNAYIANGHSQGQNGTASGNFRSQGIWYNQYELTYGLTDRIEAAAYLNMAEVPGHGYWYAGSRYRLRGRLFDEEVLPVNLGWYAELEWHKTPQFDSNELEIEFRPIAEKDIGRWSLVADPIFEKAAFVGPDKNKGFELAYSCGVYYRWQRYLSPGVEFYGAIGKVDDTDPLHAQQHYIFPVIWGAFHNGIEYSVGPGFGLTRGSDHVLLKFNLEFEKFVGALMPASGDGGWFF